jgi:hypothetical protein
MSLYHVHVETPRLIKTKNYRVGLPRKIITHVELGVNWLKALRFAVFRSYPI